MCTVDFLIASDLLDGEEDASSRSKSCESLISSDSVEDLLFQAREFVKMAQAGPKLVTTSDWKHIQVKQKKSNGRHSRKNSQGGLRYLTHRL